MKFRIIFLSQVYKVYEALSAISPMFSIAAAFGNVHGVYKAGNVVLSPHLLKGHQEFIKKQISSPLDKPTFLVMHGKRHNTKRFTTSTLEIKQPFSHSGRTLHFSLSLLYQGLSNCFSFSRFVVKALRTLNRNFPVFIFLIFLRF